MRLILAALLPLLALISPRPGARRRPEPCPEAHLDAIRPEVDPQPRGRHTADTWRAWRCPRAGCQFSAVREMSHPCPLQPAGTWQRAEIVPPYYRAYEAEQERRAAAEAAVAPAPDPDRHVLEALLAGLERL